MFDAEFTGTAQAPGDSLLVVIPDFDDGENEHGPVLWQPHPDGTLPATGDQALVAESASGWWVLAWTSA